MNQIRLATPNDAAALASLRYEFRAEIATVSEDRAAFLTRCEPWMAQRLARDDHWRCWVDEDEAFIVGTLWLQIIDKLPNPIEERELHAYITSVYIRPASRGHNLASHLIKTALDFCRAIAVDSVILWPTTRSRNLYARHGFAVREDIMERILGEEREVV